MSIPKICLENFLYKTLPIFAYRTIILFNYIMAWERYEMNVDDLTRFYDKVDKTEDCWIWNGARDKDGYGRFKLDGKVQGAHRVAYQEFVSVIPKDLHVLHHCDNTSCVNWESHLFVGTNDDNVLDKILKKRHPTKLTDEKVLEIRAKYIPRKYSTYKLAKEYGIDQSIVYDVVSRKSWKHI